LLTVCLHQSISFVTIIYYNIINKEYRYSLLNKGGKKDDDCSSN
jgi:hypothetical protein